MPRVEPVVPEPSPRELEPLVRLPNALLVPLVCRLDVCRLVDEPLELVLAPKMLLRTVSRFFAWAFFRR